MNLSLSWLFPMGRSQSRLMVTGPAENSPCTLSVSCGRGDLNALYILRHTIRGDAMVISTRERFEMLGILLSHCPTWQRVWRLHKKCKEHVALMADRAL